MDARHALPGIQQELRGYFRSLTKHDADADDISQIAALRCWERWRDSDPTSLKRLLITVGRNFYYSDRTRSRSRNKLLRSHHDQRQCPSPDLKIEKEEVSSLLRRAVQALPPIYQRMIELVYFCDLSLSEAASRMGIPVNTVKSYHLRAMRRLRAHRVLNHL